MLLTGPVSRCPLVNLPCKLRDETVPLEQRVGAGSRKPCFLEDQAMTQWATP